MLSYIKIRTCRLLAAASLLLPATLKAQKSVDISAGVKAPAEVKADGKLTEWSTPLAYNKSTGLHYILANDANNLYLAINATDETTINKILGGGITLLINKEGKKKDKDAIEIVYPMGGGRSNMRSMRMGGRGNRQAGNPVDTSEIISTRKQAVKGMKELSVIGIKEVSDTLVSIYNTYGLKTGITIDAHGSFNYELSVPLKLLDLDPAKNTELAYNIIVNGITMGGGNREGGRRGGGRANGGGGGGMIMISEPTMGGGMMDMMTSTDFWGKYKLAKP